MATVEKEIQVDVPVSAAYNQWTQFEEFPVFMEGVEEVEQLEDERLRWVATVGGKRQEWYARITEQLPDEVIAWESEEGAKNAGRVVFAPIDETHARILLQIAYQPDDVMENIGDKLGFMQRRVEGDLERFKEFIEDRGIETGAWRGEIREAS